MTTTREDYALLAIDSYRYSADDDPGIPAGEDFDSLAQAEIDFYGPALANAHWARIPNGDLSIAFDAVGFSWSEAIQDSFYAAAYKNLDTQEIVIAYRGTDQLEALEPGEFDENFFAYVNEFPPGQFFYAQKYYAAVKEAFGSSDISITGHSLGGGLAAAVGYRNALETVTFAAIPSDWVVQTLDGHDWPEDGNVLPMSSTNPSSLNIMNFAINGEIALWNTVTNETRTVGADVDLLQNILPGMHDLQDSQFSDWENAYPAGSLLLDLLLSEKFDADFAASIHEVGLHALNVSSLLPEAIVDNLPRLLRQLTNDLVVKDLHPLMKVAGDLEIAESLRGHSGRFCSTPGKAKSSTSVCSPIRCAHTSRR